MTNEIVLRDVWHLATMSRKGERLSHVDVLIRESRIANIGRDLEQQVPPAPGVQRTVIDARTCLALPGLVNTHHHLFQTMTRAVPAVQNAKLFDWLVRLYEVWKFLDPDVVHAATQLGCAELLLTGCTTTSDHHYLFPRATSPQLLDAQLEAAAQVGIRFHATRGSMSMGQSSGGLPPDSIVQDEDSILLDCERIIERYHDAAPFAMRRIALAPCAPFAVTQSLMRQTVRLARQHGLRCHTHLAETEDENRYCLERYGCRPLALMQELEWVGPDIWYAHGVHFTDAELDVLSRTRTGIAHCPSSNMRLGSGIPRVPEMMARGIPVGLGVDGSASNDSCDMLAEVRQALLLARVRYGSAALTATDALQLATRGGSQLLGRSDEIGSLEVGRAADIVLIDLDRIDFAGALSDPLAAIVFAGIGHRVHTSIVNGKIVVRDGRLVTADETEIAHRAHELSFRMLRQAGIALPYGTPPWLPATAAND